MASIRSRSFGDVVKMMIGFEMLIVRCGGFTITGHSAISGNDFKPFYALVLHIIDD